MRAVVPFPLALATFLGCVFSVAACGQTIVRLRSGVLLEGSLYERPVLASNENDARPIWTVDDNLRRIFLHSVGMVQSHQPAPAETKIQFEIYQPREDGLKQIQVAGPLIRQGPFNVYGRRFLQMQASDGPLMLAQGITLLTPKYAKVEAFENRLGVAWDMRIATSSIPTKELRGILNTQLQGPEDLNGRLENVRFFLAASRYEEGIAEIDDALKIPNAPPTLLDQRRELVQQHAAKILKEAQARERVGQRSLARRILQQMPGDGVAGETKILVQESLERMDADEKLSQQLVQRLSDLLAQLGNPLANELQPLLEEVKAQVTPSSQARLDDFLRLGDDASLPLENRIAMGLGGWMLGPSANMQNLSIVRSLYEARGLITRYLIEPDAGQRGEILEKLSVIEGAVPAYVAKILEHLPPPLPDTNPFADPKVPGMFHFTSSRQDLDEHLEYTIQLPPEYDPLRRYPCVLALHPQTLPPAWEVDWWAGPWVESTSDSLGVRMGQASRHGFIVLAPRWNRDGERYKFTAREHQRVLAALRDALRRFSIDTDRVYLAGHADGGTAAWDIAGAHPDLWAGLIVIGGRAEKFIKHYSANLRSVPVYLLVGELTQPMNPQFGFPGTIDRYLNARYDFLLVTYRGRGEEDFYEEIHHLFEWMNAPDHQRRKPPPKEFEGDLMRANDNFFWWLEAQEIDSKMVISPLLYDVTSKRDTSKLGGRVSTKNSVAISKSPGKRVVVLLSPDIGLDMQDQVQVTWGNRRTTTVPGGNLKAMLEDARTRADRQHPAWDRVVLP
jgi:pimeloyl-ACP methyl ester carboxylesterase